MLSGGMFVATLSLGFIATSVRQAKSTAVGLYVTVYYAGGACGAWAAVLWHEVGWPGVVALIASAAAAIGASAGLAWKAA